jgi:hypothetical protein
MIFGAMLMVAFAYIHDSRVPAPAGGPVAGAPAGSGAPASGPHTLVNWTVAEARWAEFTAGLASLGRQAQDGFTRLARQF